jgi:hypothetical protein
MADEPTNKVTVKDLAGAIGLYKEVQNPVAWESVWTAVRHGAKTAIAAGLGYGLIVLVGVLQQDASSSHLLTLFFSLVSAQAVIAAISKFIAEHYGVTLPF